MLKIEHFTVEYRRAALGLDVRRPRFSWVLQSQEKNVMQAAYRLRVLQEDGAEVWDSGETADAQSVLVEYDGAPLQKQTRYRVRLAAADSLGRRAEAETAFETGLFAEFTAPFITCAEAKTEGACPVFEKRFCVQKNVRRARLYATALGLYEAELNGRKAGDAFFTPGWTSYAHRLQYQTYDVTSQIAADNVLRVTLANGWYKGTILTYRNVYGDQTALLAELHLWFEDGSHQVIGTDESWLAGAGQILYSDLYHGETVDTARPAFTPTGHAFAAERGSFALSAQESIPVRVHEELPVKETILTPSGKTVLDFGQNMSGLIRLHVRAPKGTRITIRHGEVLDQRGELYTENLRTARCTDEFITNGEEQTLMARFTYHGFRYAQVEGLENVSAADFTACVLHSGMARTGDFHCSDPLVNRLWQNIRWGQKSNFVDVPTDCPQRDERLGWTGDAQIFCHTATLQMNVALFFEKWLRDLAAEQTPDRGVPHMVPNLFGSVHGTAAWGDAATVIPWTLYGQYGDERVLREQYPSMKGWVDYITSQSTADGLWQTNFQYGDWLALDKEEGSDRTGATDPYLIATAFYAYSAQLVSNAARVIGKTEDAAAYAALHDRIVRAFRREYITPNGRIVSQTQTALVLGLMFGLFEAGHVNRAREQLRANLAAHTDHLVTGFVGTPYLCGVLSDSGMHDLAATVVRQRDYPSWLYAVRKGATTVWERWNGIRPDGSFESASMNSFNHYAYGAVGRWLVEKLAGLSAAEPGYRRIRMQPRPAEGFPAASATLETPYGTAECGYCCRDGVLRVRVRVPCNTQAELTLPEGRGTRVLGSGEYTFEFPAEKTYRKDAYTAQTKLITLLEDPAVSALLQQRCPEVLANPQLPFCYERPLTEAAQMIPCDFAHFQAALDLLNREAE